MFESIKRKLKDTYLFGAYLKIRSVKRYWNWIESGKPVPPPHVVKRMVVLEYANRFDAETFVETGTYLGDMVYAVRNSFNNILSIELSKDLYDLVKKRFAGYDHIQLINGDSYDELKNVIGRTSGICLFWLDGHYSGGITAKGKKDAPIIEELQAILESDLENYVILIDDARTFSEGGVCPIGDKNDYPTIKQIEKMVHDKCDDYIIYSKDDIIRIHKKICDVSGKPKPFGS